MVNHTYRKSLFNTDDTSVQTLIIDIHYLLSFALVNWKEENDDNIRKMNLDSFLFEYTCSIDPKKQICDKVFSYIISLFNKWNPTSNIVFIYTGVMDFNKQKILKKDLQNQILDFFDFSFTNIIPGSNFMNEFDTVFNNFISATKSTKYITSTSPPYEGIFKNIKVYNINQKIVGDFGYKLSHWINHFSDIKHKHIIYTDLQNCIPYLYRYRDYHIYVVDDIYNLTCYTNNNIFKLNSPDFLLIHILEKLIPNIYSGYNEYKPIITNIKPDSITINFKNLYSLLFPHTDEKYSCVSQDISPSVTKKIKSYINFIANYVHYHQQDDISKLIPFVYNYETLPNLQELIIFIKKFSDEKKEGIINISSNPFFQHISSNIILQTLHVVPTSEYYLFDKLIGHELVEKFNASDIYNLRLNNAVIKNKFLNSIYIYCNNKIKAWNLNTYKSYGIWDQNDTRCKINSRLMNCMKISNHTIKNDFNYTDYIV